VAPETGVGVGVGAGVRLGVCFFLCPGSGRGGVISGDMVFSFIPFEAELRVRFVTYKNGACRADAG
jgi:hypothetical protein